MAGGAGAQPAPVPGRFPGGHGRPHLRQHLPRDHQRRRSGRASGLHYGGIPGRRLALLSLPASAHRWLHLRGRGRAPGAPELRRRVQLRPRRGRHRRRCGLALGLRLLRSVLHRAGRPWPRPALRIHSPGRPGQRRRRRHRRRRPAARMGAAGVRRPCARASADGLVWPRAGPRCLRSAQPGLCALPDRGLGSGDVLHRRRRPRRRSGGDPCDPGCRDLLLCGDGRRRCLRSGPHVSRSYPSGPDQRPGGWPRRPTDAAAVDTARLRRPGPGPAARRLVGSWPPGGAVRLAQLRRRSRAGRRRCRSCRPDHDPCCRDRPRAVGPPRHAGAGQRLLRVPGPAAEVRTHGRCLLRRCSQRRGWHVPEHRLRAGQGSGVLQRGPGGDRRPLRWRRPPAPAPAALRARPALALRRGQRLPGLAPLPGGSRP